MALGFACLSLCWLAPTADAHHHQAACHHHRSHPHRCAHLLRHRHLAPAAPVAIAPPSTAPAAAPSETDSYAEEEEGVEAFASEQERESLEPSLEPEPGEPGEPPPIGGELPSSEGETVTSPEA